MIAEGCAEAAPACVPACVRRAALPFSTWSRGKVWGRGGGEAAAGDVLDHARAFPVRSALTSLWNGIRYAGTLTLILWLVLPSPSDLRAKPGQSGLLEPARPAWPGSQSTRSCRLVRGDEVVENNSLSA